MRPLRHVQAFMPLDPPGRPVFGCIEAHLLRLGRASRPSGCCYGSLGRKNASHSLLASKIELPESLKFHVQLPCCHPVRPFGPRPSRRLLNFHPRSLGRRAAAPAKAAAPLPGPSWAQAKAGAWHMELTCWCYGVTQGFGNEPGDFLQGTHKGWFIGPIPSFPAENQKVDGQPLKQ